MPFPAWPNGLPYKPRRLAGNSEWSLAPKLPPITTTFEGGNTRQRSKPGDDVQEIQQTLRFTTDQFVTWQAFFLSYGNGRITMPVFLGGSSYETRTAQIIGVPKENNDGLKYTVTMTLRVYPA